MIVMTEGASEELKGPAGAPERVRDQRIEQVVPLVTPAMMLREQPMAQAQEDVVLRGRAEIGRVLDREDDRLLVVVGPCSVHDPEAGLDYAKRLAKEAQRHSDDLCVAMRVYFEKPRTTTGWKGLINDPHLDGSGDVNTGLRRARQLLLEVLGLGLPVGCEWLDPITPQYISDTVAWGAIGARTTESQTHRQLASGLSMPVGFKNRTDGDLGVAVDAVHAAAAPHAFAGVDMSGTPAILHTRGNPACHIILRGGRGTPNYDAATVAEALGRLRAAGLPERVVIDASHDNSGKDHGRQPEVVADIASQIAAGNAGDRGHDARVVPGGGTPEPHPRRRAHLRPVDHGRVHGLGHHGRGARPAGGRGAHEAGDRLKLAVLGVGLIGGSIGLAAREQVEDAEVVGFGRSPERLARARELRRDRQGRRLARGRPRRRRGLFRLRARGRAGGPGRGGAPRRPRGLRGQRRRLDQARSSWSAWTTSASSAATRSPAPRRRAWSTPAPTSSRAPSGT